MQPSGPIKTFMTETLRAGVRCLVAHPATRAMLNAWYLRASHPAQWRLYYYFARVFRGRTLTSGTWNVRIGGRTIRLPLRSEHAWLDWESAVSILVHDYDIKRYYSALLASPQRPDLFLDVGANYGTHSILLASQGVRCVAFEPNPECRRYCDIVCELNGLSIEWKPVAVGAAKGEVDLVYPGGETWLGSVEKDVTTGLRENFTDISVVHVPLVTLDDYPADGTRLLIKIDVEGFEMEVLKGASSLLKRARPIILFETNDHESRRDLLAFFIEHGYGVFALSSLDTPLDEARFKANAAANFVALPRQ